MQSTLLLDIMALMFGLISLYSNSQLHGMNLTNLVSSLGYITI